MRFWILWRVVVLCGLVFSPLVGSPITYTMTGNVSGSIGATPLSNAPFTFVFYGDTTGIYTFPSGPLNILMNPALATSILLSGSAGGFIEPVIVGVEPVAGVVGFADAANTKGLTLVHAGAVGWDLASPIGPLTGEPGFANGSFATTLGVFTISGGSDVSFTAANTVPEPGGALLFGCALSGLIALWRVKAGSRSKRA